MIHRSALETPRLRLCAWDERHRAPFVEMHGDHLVMADQGGPLGAADSCRKLARYFDAWRERGVGRWAVEHRDGAFLGYAGVMHRAVADHPLGQHIEIGWRFVRGAWGHGYATESARAAMAHAMDEIGLASIVAYTSTENLRSRAVMGRLGLHRNPALDFTMAHPRLGAWHGLVWVAPQP